MFAEWTSVWNDNAPNAWLALYFYVTTPMNSGLINDICSY